MSETRPETRNALEKFYLPGLPSRPSLDAVEGFLRRHLGRHGVVPLPFETADGYRALVTLRKD